jgi:hypothetical protein
MNPTAMSTGTITLLASAPGERFLNPLHPDPANVRLVTQRFSFTECLHTPPMPARNPGGSDAPTYA